MEKSTFKAELEASAEREASALDQQAEWGNLRGRSVLGARARKAGATGRRETEMHRRFLNYLARHAYTGGNP